MLNASEITNKVQDYAKNIAPDFKNWQAQTWPQRQGEGADAGINVGKWERIASAGLGAYLLYRTVKSIAKNPSVFNVVTSVLSSGFGIGLVKRGLTGHCEAYSAGGISTAGKALSSDARAKMI